MSAFAFFCLTFFTLALERSQMNQSDNRHDSEGFGDVNATGGDISV